MNKKTKSVRRKHHKAKVRTKNLRDLSLKKIQNYINNKGNTLRINELKKICNVLNSDPYFYTVLLNISSVLISGLIIMGLYRWINQNVLTDPKC